MFARAIEFPVDDPKLATLKTPSKRVQRTPSRNDMAKA
jgi:hypothetical protein